MNLHLRREQLITARAGKLQEIERFTDRIKKVEHDLSESSLTVLGSRKNPRPNPLVSYLAMLERQRSKAQAVVLDLDGQVAQVERCLEDDRQLAQACELTAWRRNGSSHNVLDRGTRTSHDRRVE